MSFQFSEDDLEQVALEWFEELGYTIKNGREISETGITPERESDKDIVLDNRLENALRRINPDLHNNAIQQAIHEISIEKSPNHKLNYFLQRKNCNFRADIQPNLMRMPQCSVDIQGSTVL